MVNRKVINGNVIELIVFDFDGTLMDSTTAIAESIQRAAADIGVPVPSAERASHIIGLGLIEALRQAIPDLPQERYQELAERYRYHYGGPIRQDRIQSSLSWSVRPSRNCMALPHSC